MIDFYLSSTRVGLSEADARDTVTNTRHTIMRRTHPFRIEQGERWNVTFLVTGPLYQGQQPFILTDEERARLETQ